jgi:hypothetical protein
VPFVPKTPSTGTGTSTSTKSTRYQVPGTVDLSIPGKAVKNLVKYKTLEHVFIKILVCCTVWHALPSRKSSLPK